MIRLHYNQRTRVLSGEGQKFMIIQRDKNDILMNIKDGHKMLLTPVQGAKKTFTFFNRRQELFKVKLETSEALFSKIS